LHKLALDCLQAFTPPSMSGLGHRIIPDWTPKLAARFLNASDFLPETPDLVSESP
jgi:hypothetical protein